MAVVACLFITASVAICVIDYNQSLTRVYAELDDALIHGTTPRDSALDILAPDDMSAQALELGGSKGRGEFVPIAVYQLISSGSLTFISSISGATISDELLPVAASAVAPMPDGHGMLGDLDLLYAKKNMRGVELVAFADSSSVSSWKNLALALIGMGIFVLIAFFAISLLLARWALAPVQQAWDKQRRFVSDASHELKTPLAVMAANTSILLKNADQTIASQSQWVESTEAEIESMRELVDDMLFMASTEEQARIDERVDVNLSRLVESQILQFESLAFERHIEMNARIEEDLVISCSRAQIDRLVRTLLENACKYTPAGGSIEVTLAHSKGVTSLQVSNTGDPIPADDLPHVFDRFYKADASRQRGDSSYGLGLSIAHDIAIANGAHMSVTSSAEKGTTFTVIWK